MVFLCHCMLEQRDSIVRPGYLSMTKEPLANAIDAWVARASGLLDLRLSTQGEVN